ncbi:Sister chromatid cohesion protein DCC1 [Chytriomyces hyalinus]|nr:Sister chromatid cohesion protein DCC1 [Chytriomyces hyalinus]
MNLNDSLDLTMGVDSNESFILVELPREVAEYVERGGVLVARGSADDEAVLCTDTTTYSGKWKSMFVAMNWLINLKPTGIHACLLRQVHNSNTLLLLDGETVRASMSGHVELLATLARASTHLSQLLREAMYNGPSNEKRRAGSNQVMRAQLLEQIQASASEIDAAVEYVGAFEMDGILRLVHPAFLNEFLLLFIASANVDEKDLNAISLEEAIQLMAENDIPEPVITQCFSMIADKNDDNLTYTISPKKLCRITGSEVLMSLQARTSLDEFMKIWRKSTPSPFEIQLDYLQGLYILEDDTGISYSIRYFPKSDLPAPAKDRLEYLFSVRRKWTTSDLMPYIDDLAENKKKLDLLLLKYTRMSKVGDTVFYSAR